MSFRESSLPLLVIVGPTAVGKTEFSIQLAQNINGEIISADSRLLYRGMDIGTAKPSIQERELAPHHLIDVADPDDLWSLACYQQAAYQTIDNIHARGRIPMLVGGSGQYIRAITQGWAPPLQSPDAGLRTIINDWGKKIGAAELHRKLSLVDPEAAAIIDPNNLRRTVRALEVIYMTGEKFSLQRKQQNVPYSILMIGLKRSRPVLFERIDLRIEKMIAEGLEQEVRNLLEKGYSADLPTLSAIGYREMIEFIKGESTLEEAVIKMKRMTRLFVRRQANWFKEKDTNICWFDVDTFLLEEVMKVIMN